MKSVGVRRRVEPENARHARIGGHGRLARACSVYEPELLERRLLLSSATVRLTKEQTLGTGSEPEMVVVADVNGDGKSDLVAPCYYNYSVTVILGNGNGTFRSPQEFPAGTHPTAVAVLDVNGDGKQDLAVADAGTNSVSILLGNGDGTFGAALTFAAGTSPQAVVLRDLNGDNKPDLIVGNEFSSFVSVLLNNGNGTFAGQVTFAAGSNSSSLAMADFNSDGKVDLAVGNGSILLGNGNGTFQPRQTLALGGGSLTAADLNGDGKPDLAMVNTGVGILLSNGNGTFQAPRTIGDASPPRSVAVADFNGDGKQDLAIANYNQKSIGVLLGNGDGTYLPQQLFSAVTYPGSIAATDFDGDGRPDLVFAHPYSNLLGVMLNQTGLVLPEVVSINRTTPAGPTTIASSVTFTVTFNKPVTGVDLGDFAIVTNGVTFTSTGINPVSASIYAVSIGGITGTGTIGLNLVDNGTIRDLAGNRLVGGAATFGSPIPLSTRYYNSVAVADVNGDGKPDLGFAGAYNGPFASFSYSDIRLGNGDGSFQMAKNMTFAQGSYPKDITFADMNGDGVPDMALAYANYYAVGVLLGNGDGTYKAGHSFAAGMSPDSLAVGDLNGDGKMDLVEANQNGVISILLGNGNGTLQAQQTIADGMDTVAVVVADLNGDGRPDLAVGNLTYMHYSLDVLLGNGNGTFKAPQSVVSEAFNALTAVDINGDGKTDLVGANAFGNVTVLLANGNGTFQPEQTFAVGAMPSSMAVADFNGDGNLDVVTTDSQASSLSVLVGNGNGTFRPRATVAVSPLPFAVAGADLNSDGLADLVVLNLSAMGTVLSPGTSLLLAQSNGSFTGQVYTIVPVADVINGTPGNDTIVLQRNSDGTDINWTMGATNGEFPANDPAGLTINGNGGNDIIDLDYTNGDPLPNSLHLNGGTGTFTINNLLGTNPLAGTTLEIGRSTVFISYGGTDPIAAIKSYLQTAYNAGAWNGSPTATTGVITSAAAAANPNHNTAIGYADWADGQGINTVPNTIEFTYTLYGDANLDHVVNSADLQRFLAFFNTSGPWDEGDFNYDGVNNSADQQIILFNFNTSLGSQATPLAVAAASGAAAPASAPSSAIDPSSPLIPAITTQDGRQETEHGRQKVDTAEPTTVPIHHPHPRIAARKRR